LGYFVWKITILRQKIIFLQLPWEARKFLRYFVWKITILRQKNHIFSNFRGGDARRVRPPPWICPCFCLISDSPLLRRPIIPTAHCSDSPFLRQPFIPSKMVKSSIIILKPVVFSSIPNGRLTLIFILIGRIVSVLNKSRGRFRGGGAPRERPPPYNWRCKLFMIKSKM
jgi:hypothetical protein